MLIKSFLTIICLFPLISFSQVNQTVNVNQEASFPGGDNAMIQYLWKNIKPTELSKGNVITDDIMISLDVLPDSTIKNIILLKTVGLGIDEQVVQLLKQSKFIPSIQNGTPVLMNLVFTIPIRLRH